MIGYYQICSDFQEIKPLRCLGKSGKGNCEVTGKEMINITKGKDSLENRVCIRDNALVSVPATGAPDDAGSCCEKLIDYTGSNAGFIVDLPAGIIDSNTLFVLTRIMRFCKLVICMTTWVLYSHPVNRSMHNQNGFVPLCCW
jgi:hypothetical protein